MNRITNHQKLNLETCTQQEVVAFLDKKREAHSLTYCTLHVNLIKMALVILKRKDVVYTETTKRVSPEPRTVDRSANPCSAQFRHKKETKNDSNDDCWGNLEKKWGRFRTAPTKPFLRELKKLPAEMRARVLLATVEITSNPYADVRLRGELSGLLRWRTGDSGIVYRMDEERSLVVLLDVGPRESVSAELFLRVVL